MTIHIQALTFEVIIGLLDFERTTPQRIIVDLESRYDYTPEAFVNYADIVTSIQEELHQARYELLEEALLGLKTRLHHTYPQLKTLSLKLTKPDILPQCAVSLSEHWEF